MPMSALRSAVPRQQADETPFVVGVTSWNGSIEVLGRFDGMRWVNTWPEVDEPSRPVPRLADMPTAWLGKPVPREWHAQGLQFEPIIQAAVLTSEATVL